MLPAIQAAREAGRRADCSSKLHNIGIALHNYHDVKGYLPPGRGVMQNGVLNHIQPFMEMQNSTKSYVANHPMWFAHPDDVGFGGDFWYTHAWTASRTRFDVFVCPSVENSAHQSFKMGRIVFDESGVPDPRVGGVWYGGWYSGLATYVPCAGWGDGPDTAGIFGSPGEQYATDGTDREDRRALSDIKDGTSNTLAIGEYLGGPLSAGSTTIYRAPWMAGVKMTSWQTPWPQAPGNTPPIDRFSSRHPQITQFALADASVRPIQNSIDLASFIALNGIRDGVVADPSRY
ncbi:MAG: DUF1559 domain-containing protein [Pirellulales bacterium]|nr:DUF1559 domain-containing protein [Pirellulales bacterium]